MAGCFFIKTIFPIAMCTIQEYPLGSAIIRKGAGDYMDKKDMTSLNKYDFNAYDTAIALILTRYLSSTGEVKKELGRVVGTGTIDGTALADLLDRAAAWAEEGIKPSDDPKTEKLMDAVKTVLDGFSGKRYVQSIDAGFCQFLDDFYNDRIAQ